MTIATEVGEIMMRHADDKRAAEKVIRAAFMSVIFKHGPISALELAASMTEELVHAVPKLNP